MTSRRPVALVVTCLPAARAGCSLQLNPPPALAIAFDDRESDLTGPGRKTTRASNLGNAANKLVRFLHSVPDVRRRFVIHKEKPR